MEYVKTATKYGSNMSCMQAKCKESEVNALGMQTLETYYRRPILFRLFFVLMFVGIWTRLCQGSSLGLEPIPLFRLFILSSL